jgi:hypothetical protein
MIWNMESQTLCPCGFLALFIKIAGCNIQLYYKFAGHNKQNGFSVHKAIYFNWLKLVFFLNN